MGPHQKYLRNILEYFMANSWCRLKFLSINRGVMFPAYFQLHPTEDLQLLPNIRVAQCQFFHRANFPNQILPKENCVNCDKFSA